MSVMETIKARAERATGIGRPGKKEASELVRARKAHGFRFKDDGLIPNNPKWPFVLYRGCVQLKATMRPPRPRALKTIPKTAKPRKDLVYGAKGPLP
jgi:hypothetical protein